jgi:hypothetical protein
MNLDRSAKLRDVFACMFAIGIPLWVVNALCLYDTSVSDQVCEQTEKT